MRKQAELIKSRNKAFISSSQQIIRRQWKIEIETEVPERIDNPLCDRLDDIWERIDAAMTTLVTELTVKGGGT